MRVFVKCQVRLVIFGWYFFQDDVCVCYHIGRVWLGVPCNAYKYI